MEGLISGLNKTFDSRIRLGIMSILSVNDSADFTTMKQLMDLTDGNLATHLKALETAGYIASSKQFIGRKPNTSYAITAAGRRDFKAHIDALGELLNSNDEKQGSTKDEKPAVAKDEKPTKTKLWKVSRRDK